DCAGNSSSQSQVITVQDTSAPVLSGVPGDTTVECDNIPAAASPSASDNCDPSPSVSLVEVSTKGECADNYTITRTWTATDCAGNSSSQSQVITVQDTTAPVLFGVPNDVTVECDSVPTKATGVTALDNCDNDVTITYGEVRTDGDCPQSYILTRTWTATDCAGNSSSESQVITVQDTTAPVLSLPGDKTFECSMGDAGTATATDNCDPSPVVTYTDDDTGLDSCGYGTIVRTWKAVDCSGNEAMDTQNITIQDTTPPTIEAPRGAIRACGDCWTLDEIPDADPSTVTAFDNCDGELVAQAEPLRPIGLRDCATGELLVDECPRGWERVWYVEDCAGNRAEAVEQYLCLSSNEITDSSLCMFDRTCDEPDQQFRVIYTPDTENDPYHMISSTNPGQFFYNIFYVGTPGEVVDVEICLPFPFTTKGANPIHVYDWVTIEECGIFGVRFIPGDVVYTDSQQITLEDHVAPTTPGDNLEGYCFDELISFTVPDTGVAYLNIHLEYGVVHMGDFDQDVKQNAVDPRTKNIYLRNKAPHYFSFGLWDASAIEDDPDMTGMSVAYNMNDFQKTAGVTGHVLDGDGVGVPGAVITMTAGNRRRADIPFSVTTDADGEYFIPYVHQGTPTMFKVMLNSPGSPQMKSVLLKNKGLGVVDFTID
ncbi:MAG: carboxypeptidase-like regulatory domain-containing protein, partial [Puniceicoccaceae bacterium]